MRGLLRSGVPPHRLLWLRLDHPLLMQLPLNVLIQPLVDEVRAAAATGPAFVFFDELTYARDWDLWLKTFYDEDWPVVISGSSSSTAALRNRRLESGVGRWDEQYLAPYSFGEYLALVGVRRDVPAAGQLADAVAAAIDARVPTADLAAHRRRFLLTGGFPELLLSATERTADEQTVTLESQRTLKSDAVERAIYKDIPQAFGVDNPMMLERLLYTLAGQVTGILSPNNICRALDGLSQPTFDRYLAYLERAFLVFTVPNYSGTELSKQKRGRKLYFVDGAVRNAALQRGVAPLADTHEMGLLAENLAAGHLHALGQQSQVRLYYWRDGQDEVDLVYDHPDGPMAFEIGMSETHHRGGLHALIDRHPKFRGRSYVVAPNAAPVQAAGHHDGVGSLPLDLFLLVTSAQADRELSHRLRAAT